MDVDTFTEKTLSYPGWGNLRKDRAYSANDVLKNPQKNREDFVRIKEADLKFPIIVYAGAIVDGVHRLARCVLEKRLKL